MRIRAYKLASERAIEGTKGKANEQRSGRVNEQTNERANELTCERAKVWRGEGSPEAQLVASR